MRIIAAALAITAVSPAAAQPVTRPTTCEVRFVRVPDDVRHVIEGYLAAEPSCTTSIDLRVLPTDEGYYLLAQRSDGRIHERVVPDAQTAGVIVASWVADDRIERPVVRAPDPVIVNPLEGTPELVAHVPAASTRSPKWLTLAAMTRAFAGGSGMRGELDLVTLGPWTLGAALSGSRALHSTWVSGWPASFETTDLKAVAYLARTSTFGRWQLRIAAGAGVLHTSTSAITHVPTSAGSVNVLGGTSPAAEGSIALSRRLGQDWAVTAGPVLTWMSQGLVTWDPYSWDPKMTIAGRTGELMFVAGMRHEL